MKKKKIFTLNRVKMTGRSLDEEYRASTPLELFFDLIFVIAIASAARSLHLALVAHEIIQGLMSFGAAFFSIWWAWMNFTWFSSAYDTDDTPFRLTTFLLMFGALIFAASVDDIFNLHTRPIVPVIGFIIMRIAMIIHWLRAAKEQPENKDTHHKYGGGIAFAQVLWVLWIFIPATFQFFAFLVFALVELYVPIFSEGKKVTTTWHPQHIAERYGLLTLIVLGEGLLGTSDTVAGLLRSDTHWTAIVFPTAIAACASVIIFSLWWIYFELPWAKTLAMQRTRRVAFVFGYFHFFTFAALAAVGSSIELVADYAHQTYMPLEETPKQPISALFAITALSCSLGIYLLSINWMRISIIQKSRYHYFALYFGIFIVALSVGLVYVGVDLLWALIINIIGLLFYIVLFSDKEKVRRHVK